MVYVKRRYYRRYRRGKVLSTRNIFNNKSSRSQARQIYRLNRRVSALSKATKPEVKTAYQSAESFSFRSDQLTNTYKGYVILGPGQGTSETRRIGDKISIKNAQLNFMFEYFNNSDNGYHDTESSGTPIRIIVGQYKHAVSGLTPSFSTVLQEYGGSGASYTNMALSPLANNITENHNILYDKTFTVTSARNQLIKRINIKPQDYRWATETTYNNVWIYIICSGLHYDDNFRETVEGTFNCKLAFTDA